MGLGQWVVAKSMRYESFGETGPVLYGRENVSSCQQGFTIMEALVVVSIAAIVLTLGVPSFQNAILSNRLTTTANAFVSSYNTARLTAIRRNAAVQFCGGSPIANGTEVLGVACGTESGAAYQLDVGGTSATKAVEAPVVPPGVTVGQAVGLRFSGQGFARNAVGATVPYTGLLLDLSSSRLTVNNRRCVYLATGSIISVCAVSSTGACNAIEPSTCG